MVTSTTLCGFLWEICLRCFLRNVTIYLSVQTQFSASTIRRPSCSRKCIVVGNHVRSRNWASTGAASTLFLGSSELSLFGLRASATLLLTLSFSAKPVRYWARWTCAMDVSLSPRTSQWSPPVDGPLQPFYPVLVTTPHLTAPLPLFPSGLPRSACYHPSLVDADLVNKFIGSSMDIIH